MTQGLGVFKAIGKDGCEINMADMKLKDVRQIEKLEVANEGVL